MPANLFETNQLFFYKNPTAEAIQSWATGISDKANLFIQRVNTVNEDILSLVDLLASDASKMSSKLRESSDQLSSLLVVSGRNNNSISPFLEDVRFETNGVYFDRQSETLSLAFNKLSVNPVIRLASSSRVELGIPSDLSVKFSDLDNIKSKTTYCGFHNYGRSCSIDLDISLEERSSISGISFNCNTFGAVPPRITGIAYRRGSDLVNVVIEKTNTFQVDLANYDFSSKVEVVFSEVKTDRLIVSIVQPNMASGFENAVVLGINEFEVFKREYVESGEIVFGPIDFDDEVLKTAVDLNILNFDHYNNLVKIEVSTNKEDWIEVSPSAGASNSPKKVLSFNTINQDSIKTNSPVRRLYLKLSLSAKMSPAEVETGSYTKAFFDYAGYETSYFVGTDFNSTNTTLISYSPKNIFGTRDSYSSVGKEILENRNLQKISSNGIPLIRTSKVENSSIDSVTFFTSPRRLSVTYDQDFRSKLDDSNFVDVSTLQVFSCSNPSISTRKMLLREGRHSSEKEWFGLKLKPSIAPGLYVVVDKQKRYEVDLSLGMILSNEGMVFEVESDDAYLYMPANGYRINLEKTTVEDKKYVSLSKDLCVAPVSDKSYEFLYPVIDLTEDSFTISEGTVISPLNVQIESTVAVVRKNQVLFSYEKETSSLILGHPSLSRHTADLSQFNYQNMAFLGRTGIINNTFEFDNSGASVNTFIREVKFVDGKSEFRFSTRWTQVVSKSNPVNQFNLDSSFVDNDTIVFNDSEGLFINRVYSQEELITKGDYFIEDNTVYLPSGYYTSDILDLIIDYDIDNRYKVTSGLFSVDYDGGYIHTSSPIDGNIKVSFSYSNVFSSGVSGKKIKSSDYSVNGGALKLKNGSGTDFKYMAIGDISSLLESTKITSPVINSLYFNYVSSKERF